MEHIRTLHKCRQALRKSAFQHAAGDPKYNNAIARLTTINDTIKTEIIAHNKTLEFANDAAMAAAAVLDLTIAIGAIAA